MSIYVYMIASKRNGTLYIGMTDEMVRRVSRGTGGWVYESIRRKDVDLV
jgi:predicted GIY-YIG superfamily endonuclease